MSKPKKANIPLILKWVRFWNKRSSLVVKDKKYIVNNIYEVENYENLFFTTNWYIKNTKERVEKYISNVNCFFFDVDLKDNPHLIKEEIYEKVISFENDFDFIIESKNGYHFYIIFENWKYLNSNWSIDFVEYKKKWQEDREFYEIKMQLNIDKNATNTTQLARIPWSIHHKMEEWQDPFLIKIIKWENLLEDNTIDLINKIPIWEVIEKFWIEYDKNDNCLHDKNWKTNGRKLSKNGNFVNDFTNKSRPIWGPYNFIFQHYLNNSNIKDSKERYKKWWFW